jgi:hypothetical protein
MKKYYTLYIQILTKHIIITKIIIITKSIIIMIKPIKNNILVENKYQSLLADSLGLS